MIKKVIGYSFIIISIITYTYTLVEKRNRVEDYNNKITYSLNKETSYKYLDMDDLYDMVLVIPKINLKRGIYKKDDNRNNINQNVTINKDSDYPNQDNSNVILMAHSGSGEKAFFNRLEELNSDSLIELYYNHTKYIYKLDTSYCVLKNGSVEVIKEKNRKAITLITCSKKDKNMQVVYVGYLIDEISY